MPPDAAPFGVILGPEMIQSRTILLLLLGLMMPGPSSIATPSASGTGPADLVLLDADVVSVDPPGTTRASVAIRGGTIVFVGGSEQALALRGPTTRVASLHGYTLIPGLVDAHGHVSSLGFAMHRVDLVGTGSASEIASKIRAAASGRPAGAWIQGRGWDQNDWAVKEFPTAKILDEAAPSHPVALGRIDGHALWVNTRALEAAGITRKTPDPDGGRIERDASGLPIGILVDNAMELVQAKIPSPGRDETKEAILRALNRCLDSGLTEVHDAGISLEEASIYRELAAEGRLPIRVYAMLGGTHRSLSNYFADPPIIGAGDGYLTLRAIKLVIDGALGSRGAALFDDYSDAPGQRGLLTRDPAEVRALATQAISRGYQVCVHAIGDRGNALALDALEAAIRQSPKTDHRFRIEHAQILRPEDIPRFKAAGIIPSMQPTHCTSDMPWAESRIGPKRIAGAYAWRKLLDTGVRIPFGSDFPVESENPFLGLYAAVTRQDLDGNPKGGWRPEERMTIGEALRAFTLDAAYAAFEEGFGGSIAEGKRADIVILSDNPLHMAARDLAKLRPAAVIVGGRIRRSEARLEESLPEERPAPAGSGRGR